jgi:hypothetical protein
MQDHTDSNPAAAIEESLAERFGERLHVAFPEIAAAEAPGAARDLSERLTAQGIVVESSRAILPTLEDVFIARVRESGR